MTTIAWDGELLAADAQMNNTHNMKTTKIFQVRDDLLGFSGDLSACLEARDWYAAGADPSKWLDLRGRDWPKLMVIQKPRDGQDPQIWIFENGPVPFQVHNKYFAIGSGSDYAMAALYLGENAVKAIDVAHAMDPHTGESWDTFSFVEE